MLDFYVGHFQGDVSNSNGVNSNRASCLLSQPIKHGFNSNGVNFNKHDYIKDKKWTKVSNSNGVNSNVPLCQDRIVFVKFQTPTE